LFMFAVHTKNVKAQEVTISTLWKWIHV
jgi:hypothetical protein